MNENVERQSTETIIFHSPKNHLYKQPILESLQESKDDGNWENTLAEAVDHSFTMEARIVISESIVAAAAPLSEEEKSDKPHSYFLPY